MYHESQPQVHRAPWRHTNVLYPTADFLFAHMDAGATITARYCVQFAKNIGLV